MTTKRNYGTCNRAIQGSINRPEYKSVILAPTIERAADLLCLTLYILEKIEIPFTQTPDRITILGGGTISFICAGTGQGFDFDIEQDGA
jgi:hypothetical protein